MKAAVINKISTYAFLAMMLVSGVILILFYSVGYDNMSQVPSGAMVVDPQFTDLLMFWMYGLTALGVGFVLIFVFAQFFLLLKSNPGAALKSLSILLLLAALFGTAYALASDAPINTVGGLYEDKPTLIISDVCLYVQYVLVTIAVLGTVLSLLGAFNVFNRVKA